MKPAFALHYPSDHPHRRRNALTGEYILVSPHRTKRPWQGKVETVAPDTKSAYDPGCYLCPGNSRAGGVTNPPYASTYAFDNDFAAILSDTSTDLFGEEAGLFSGSGLRGICRVVCFSPRHDLTLALMNTEQIRGVIDLWEEQYRDLGSRDFISYVQIFENRGDIMGCSNPHPHGQIWSGSWIPWVPMLEQQRQQEFLHHAGTCLLCRYVEEEIRASERIIFENDDFVALCPFWAVWPFETMIVPRRHLADISALDAAGRQNLSDAMRRMGIRFDNLFATSFPYSMGIHQQPTDGAGHPEWHFHIHYLPPLLRSASVRKFMVGFELLAEPQRDITPEQSARQLRECAEVHFSPARPAP